jgi:hypothetical protein
VIPEVPEGKTLILKTKKQPGKTASKLYQEIDDQLFAILADKLQQETRSNEYYPKIWKNI